jgi:hypothetical protein
MGSGSSSSSLTQTRRAPIALVSLVKQLHALEDAKVYLLLQARAGIRRMVLEVSRLFVDYLVFWGRGGLFH